MVYQNLLDIPYTASMQQTMLVGYIDLCLVVSGVELGCALDVLKLDVLWRDNCKQGFVSVSVEGFD